MAKPLDVVEDADGYTGTVVEVADAVLIEYANDHGRTTRYEWWPAKSIKVVKAYPITHA